MNERKISVLIVDDSIIIRGIIGRILNEAEGFEVVGTAIDGQSAIRITEELKPDFITLDINMPRKTGLEVLPDLLRVSPKTKIIIASSMTTKNASVSMKALELGASECLHMPDAKNPEELKRFSRELVNCLIALSGENPMLLSEKEKPKEPQKLNEILTDNQVHRAIYEERKAQSKQAISNFNIVKPNNNKLNALAIASSTGGPHALAELFKQLNGNIPNVPIFITQHMPPAFTMILANNIALASGTVCKEGVNDEIVKNKHIYIAPGDYHMTAVKNGDDVVIKVNQDAMENYCRPSADPMMRSLVKIYGGNMMLVVLTGMGHDGLEGAKELHALGGHIVAQDKESSVVWGMPKAVAEAGIANAILPLDKIAQHIIHNFNANF
jgi:two-component system chemotaxis response regulator CheB